MRRDTFRTWESTQAGIIKLLKLLNKLKAKQQKMRDAGKEVPFEVRNFSISGNCYTDLKFGWVVSATILMQSAECPEATDFIESVERALRTQ